MLKSMKVLFGAVLVMSATALMAHAEEHPLSTIQGKDIDLKAYDHAFAGSIKGFVAFGAVDEARGLSELTMKKDGQIIRTEFKKQADGRFGGMIQHTNEDGAEFKTELYFVKAFKDENKIVFNINGEEIPVTIVADGFANNHFENPTYTAVVKGETISYTLKGKACFGFSTHLGFMILGAYLH